MIKLNLQMYAKGYSGMSSGRQSQSVSKQTFDSSGSKKANSSKGQTVTNMSTSGSYQVYKVEFGKETFYGESTGRILINSGFRYDKEGNVWRDKNNKKYRIRTSK